MVNPDCERCGKECVSNGVGTGHTTVDGQTVCYDCAALETKEQMKRSGKATLYHTVSKTKERRPEDQVSDWTGRLTFRCSPPRVSRHNIAGKRYDVWFVGPDGYWWWGARYGDMTQIIRCKRTKERFGDKPNEYVSPEKAREWGRTTQVS